MINYKLQPQFQPKPNSVVRPSIFHSLPLKTVGCLVGQKLMEPLKPFQPIALIPAILVLLISLLLSVNGQISTPCTASMLSTFTPCLNYITGSSSNGSSPTGDCCRTLKSLMGTGMDCACLLVTANVPVQLPINRTLALSLPKACKMGGVPLQCKCKYIS